jgi:hypothetical protein
MTLTTVQIWPVVILAVALLVEGLARSDSRRVFAAILFGLASAHPTLEAAMNGSTEAAVLATAVLFFVLVLGAVYKDDFAWLLRTSGAPLIVLAVLSAVTSRFWLNASLPLWPVPLYVAGISAIAFVYAEVLRLRLYRLAGLLAAVIGTAGCAADAALLAIYESPWKGAWSFALGLAWLALAVAISSWKAGWIAPLIKAISRWTANPQPATY